MSALHNVPDGPFAGGGGGAVVGVTIVVVVIGGDAMLVVVDAVVGATVVAGPGEEVVVVAIGATAAVVVTSAGGEVVVAGGVVGIGSGFEWPPLELDEVVEENADVVEAAEAVGELATVFRQGLNSDEPGRPTMESESMLTPDSR